MDDFEKTEITQQCMEPKESVKSKQSKNNNKLKEIKIPIKPCWYMLNNYKCCNENCKFSHDQTFVNEQKQKREKELCREYYKCSTKCNKYHNAVEIMDLLKDKLNQIETIKSIIRH